MRRTELLAASALLVAGVGAGTAPASAHPGVLCAGLTVNLHLDKPLFYPVVGPVQTNVTGSANSNVGTTCSFDVLLYSAQCGNSNGEGVVTDLATNHAHTFKVQTAGSVVLVLGDSNELVGVLNAVPNALLGDSCTSGADDFAVTGAGLAVG